jgi:hypothetical protein
MRRLVLLLPVLVALQVGVQPALAWTWPVDGPVLRPFVLVTTPTPAASTVASTSARPPAPPSARPPPAR